jgi:allantoin racemase
MSRRPHRILVINPILASVFDRFDEKYLRARAGTDFAIDVESLNYGVETIEAEYDDALCAPYIVDRILRAQAKNYDAAIINCFRDPGLGAAREASDLIVVGPGEASMLLSMALGDTFTIIDVGLGKYRRFTPPPEVRRLGISDRFVSEWGADIAVASIPRNVGRVASQIVRVAKAIEKQDEPDVILLGCTGLSRVADAVGKELDTPLVDPSIAALSLAEALLVSKFRHSRRSYPKPGKKTRKVPGSIYLK